MTDKTKGPSTEATEKTDQLKDQADKAENRQEALLDEALEETMDASDPPSPKQIT